MKSVAPPPRPRRRWLITCIVLYLLFIAAHWVAVGVFSLAFSFNPCGMAGPFLFAVLWAGMFVSYKKRNRDLPHNCAHCGWKLRPAGSRKCFFCGAYQRGYCPECGYDLTGNVSGRCPECGEAFEREGETE